MKINTIFTGFAAALLVSGANAAQYRPIKMSYGAQIRPFVGATLGMQMAGYSNQLEKDAKATGVKLPEDFFSFGLEGGFRFGNYHEIYNGGMTLNFDMTTPDNIETKISNIKIAEVSTMSISAVYDNYIRLSGDKSRRVDLVLGGGLGMLDTKTNYDHVGTFAAFGDIPADDNDWSASLVLKAGVDFEITKNIALSAYTRMFIPVKAHYDLDTNVLFGGSVKYVF